MKLFGVLLCLCLVHGTCGFLAQMFGINGIFGRNGTLRRLSTLRRNGMLGRYGEGAAPVTGIPSVCKTNTCLPYTVIKKTPTYERRRYDRIPVVVGDKSTGWMSILGSISELKGYFTEGENAAGAVMNLTYPVLKLSNGTSPLTTMMALQTETPPKPNSPSLTFDVLPTMEVLVKPYRSMMYGAEPVEAIQEFRNSLGPNVYLASNAAYIAEYNSAFQIFGRRAEIWLISSYPNNPNAHRIQAVDAASYQPPEPVEPTEATEI